MVFLGMIAALTGTDLYLKEHFESQEAESFPRDLECGKGLIKLYRNHNFGFPFGFLKEKKELVLHVPLVLTSAIGGALAWMFTKKGNYVEKVGLGLAFSGAFSNLFERMTRGYVVDYFSIQKGVLKKIVMNLGDVYIVLGGAILVLKELISTIKKK